MSGEGEDAVFETPIKEPAEEDAPPTELAQPKVAMQEEKTNDRELEEDEMMGAEAIYSVSLAMRKAQSNIASIENEVKMCEDTIAELDETIISREKELDLAKQDERDVDKKIEEAKERNQELAKSLEAEQAAYSRLKSVSSTARLPAKIPDYY